MLEMLDLLDVHHGQKILEIGTGTGYNAAWLCHRLGERNVTSVEIDESVLSTARSNLATAGFHPRLVLNDGRQGEKHSAPYDRLICTYTTRDIPPAWLAQCPDGKIVTPWGGSFFSASFLTLDIKNGVGTGSFSGSPAFMWDRNARPGRGRISDLYDGSTSDKSLTNTPPQNVIQIDPVFFISLHITDAWHYWGEADDNSGEATLWLFSDDRRSWATVEYVPDAETYEVEQSGPRRLWDEVHTAYLHWQELGSPARDRFGLTATADGQRTWLDAP
jgi:protein-L-isoaspartate O-methyltransferase